MIIVSIVCYCIICWCLVLFIVSWGAASEKRRGGEVDLWRAEETEEGGKLPCDMVVIFLAPLLPLAILFGIGLLVCQACCWVGKLIGQVPYVIVTGFADIQGRMEKEK